MANYQKQATSNQKRRAAAWPGRLAARHLLLVPLLLFHLALSLAYSSLVPLGEAPDEPAHLGYTRFIAGNGRLPASLAERQAADYRSTWPPLYHFLAAGPLAAVGDAPPVRLKSVGDTPRRLIPTDGQTIAAFIHTADEAWPWRGITLAWHVGRLVSVTLTALAVMTTYAIAWRLTARRDIALSVAALHATIPQVLFTGSVLNDDNLLILLSGLILLTLIVYSQRTGPPGPGHAFFLGALLGLATVAKYNALPLWVLTLTWGGWLWLRPYLSLARSRAAGDVPLPHGPAGFARTRPLGSPTLARWVRQPVPPGGFALPGRVFAHGFIPLFALLGGAILTSGWWFLFIWLRFNQVDSLGLIRGSLAALTAGTADASLRQLTAGGGPVAIPPATVWLEWFTILFQSFWGLFGGGSTIELPGWIYWLLAVICVLAIGSYIVCQVSGVRCQKAGGRRQGSQQANSDPAITRLRSSPLSPLPAPFLSLFLLSPLLFLPLPLLRFILTGGNIVETAQGRHLFPTLPAITLVLVWGLSYFNGQPRHRQRSCTGHASAGQVLSIDDQKLGKSPHASQATSDNRYTLHITHYVLRFTLYVLRLILHPSAFILLTLILSLYSLTLIRASYPPPIPLQTTTGAVTVENRLQVKMAEGVTLVGYEPAAAGEGVLPITLVWQADSIPPADYLIELILTDPAGHPAGGWVGHPIGGRYPTRAWDKGDILRHTIPIPLLPGLPATEATLTLNLLDSSNQPATAPLTLAPDISLPPVPLPVPPVGFALPVGVFPGSPAQLRADGLPPEAPFTYRSTLSFILRNSSIAPELIAPNDNTFPAAQFWPGEHGSIAHFIVGANWPSGDYQLKSEIAYPKPVLSEAEGSEIRNRYRLFDPPSMGQTVNANFANHLTLLGYDLPQRRVQPGRSFPITLHWRAERPISQNLTVFNHLLDQAATQRGGADRIPLKYYTTLLWVPGEIVSDPYRVPVEATAPPGVYWLDVGLYPSDRPDFSLPLFVNNQPIDRNSVRLGPLKVGGPPPGLTVSEAQPQNLVNQTFGDQITLLGFNLTGADGKPIQKATRGTQAAGKRQKAKVTLFWQADTTPSADYTVFVHLLDEQGNLAAQADSPPAAGAYPTSLWDPGEIIADEHVINDLPPGRYRLQAGLYRPDTGQRLPVGGIPDGAVRLMEFEVGE